MGGDGGQRELGGHRRQKASLGKLVADTKHLAIYTKCPLGDLLLEWWAFGLLSAYNVQAIADAARQSGCTSPLVEKLASIGTYGAYPNCHRDLMRNFQHIVELPEPMTIETKLMDRTRRPPALVDVELPTLAPHETIWALSQRCDAMILG